MTAPNRQTPPPAFWCPHCEVWSQRTYHFCEKGPSLIPQMDKETRCEQVEVVPASELAEARRLWAVITDPCPSDPETGCALCGNLSVAHYCHPRTDAKRALGALLARSAPTPEEEQDA